MGKSRASFPESAEVLEMKGARTLKGKRYVSEMDKKCPPRQIIDRSGQRHCDS